MQPLISITVLSHNKAPYTRRCLESLLLSTGQRFEVIVVDNGSTDGSVEFLREYELTCRQRGIACRLLLSDTNIGAPTARNRAIAVAEGDYLAFLDNDIVVRTLPWLTGLRRALESHPRAGMVAPKLVFPFPPYPIECAGCAVSPTGRVGYLGRGEPRTQPEHDTPGERQCLISACIMVTRELIERVGDFDEAYNPVQYEDIDLCYRARAAGFTLLYEPAVEMYHFENVTTDGSVDLNFRYLTIRNGLRFKRQWRHMFEHEGGPPEEKLRWRALDRKTVFEVGDLPTLKRVRKTVRSKQ
jgi:GT2 family glycosyltransferase